MDVEDGSTFSLHRNRGRGANFLSPGVKAGVNEGFPGKNSQKEAEEGVVPPPAVEIKVNGSGGGKFPLPCVEIGVNESG
jgi:hypothetical protein